MPRNTPPIACNPQWVSYFPYVVSYSMIVQAPREGDRFRYVWITPAPPGMDGPRGIRAVASIQEVEALAESLGVPIESIKWECSERFPSGT